MTCLEIYRDVVTDMLAPNPPKTGPPSRSASTRRTGFLWKAYERVMVQVQRSAPAS